MNLGENLTLGKNKLGGQVREKSWCGSSPSPERYMDVCSLFMWAEQQITDLHGWRSGQAVY